MAESKGDEIAAAREALRVAALHFTETQKLARTKSQKIRELRLDIAKLRTQGLTWRQISDALRDTVAASPEMLRLTIAGKTKKKQPATVSRSSGNRKAISTAASVPTTSVSDTSFGRREL